MSHDCLLMTSDDLRVPPFSGKSAGKLGLATPAMAQAAAAAAAAAAVAVKGEARAPRPAMPAQDAAWEAQIRALEEMEMAAAGSAAESADVAGTGEYDDDDDYVAPSTSVAPAGYGVRGGLLPVGVPRAISHEIIVCRERRKTALIAVLAAEEAQRGGRALLVVRDGLRMMDVLAELRAEGVHGAIELGALGTAAARHHYEATSVVASSSDASAAVVGDGEAAPLPAWAQPEKVTKQLKAAVATGTTDDSDSMQSDDGAWAGDEEARAAHEAAVLEAGRRALRAGAERWKLIVAHESAIRGLDLPQLRLVILSMMPISAEAYIHIAGRTGRAYQQGRAVCVFTRRELDEAGVITRALQHVQWRVRNDPEEGNDNHGDD